EIIPLIRITTACLCAFLKNFANSRNLKSQCCTRRICKLGASRRTHADIQAVEVVPTWVPKRVSKPLRRLTTLQSTRETVRVDTVVLDDLFTAWRVYRPYFFSSTFVTSSIFCKSPVAFFFHSTSMIINSSWVSISGFS